jgi:hypothetical protein
MLFSSFAVLSLPLLKVLYPLAPHLSHHVFDISPETDAIKLVILPSADTTETTARLRLAATNLAVPASPTDLTISKSWTPREVGTLVSPLCTST